ncbi:MAG: YifB family Mg chelatase-like AAA ATPase [Chloroflexi bacterium]|nr:YifB family Mg chelatase-like AAA ATPase [Chloroflexota bacterium]
MFAKVQSAAVTGLEAALVTVEVDITNGLPAFHLVGLPDTMVQESKERVRAAIRNCGATFPLKRIAVNLAPADLRKEGPAYDLPIAVAILAATEQVTLDREDRLYLGELSFEGEIRPTQGVLPMVLLARSAGIGEVVVPSVNAAEAALVAGVRVLAADHLGDLIAHLTGQRQLATVPTRDLFSLGEEADEGVVDFAEIKGQEHAKRALEVAAAGSHNVLLTGPPGTGKTLLARALPGILPPLTFEEALEVSKVYSVAGLLRADRPLIRRRPFRAPHHTTSYAALVGGGRRPSPGEVSLAHRGVLFLDELPEFPSNALEALRQPLEDHVITISRAHGAVEYPANVMLVAAQNPCPCGYLGDPVRPCTCSPALIARYAKRLSGPLLDRFDIALDVPRLEYERLADQRPAEPSAAIRARVMAARERQRQRFAGTAIVTNSEMGPAEVRQYCTVDSTGAALLKAAVSRLQLSGRAYYRVLKLARTIADLAGAETIGPAHVAEALQYRLRRSES